MNLDNHGGVRVRPEPRGRARQVGAFHPDLPIPRRTPPRAAEGAASPWLGWLLALGGGLGLLTALVRGAEKIGLFGGPPPVTDPMSSLNPLIGIAGFALVTAVGMILTAGVALPRRLWLGLQAAITAGLVFTHWLIFRNLYLLDAFCTYCLIACALMVPLFWGTTVHTVNRGWLPVPAPFHGIARAMTENHKSVLAAWYMLIAALLYSDSDWYERNPPGDGALAAVALICGATVMGAWLANRYADRMGLWLSLASAMMMVTALTDIVPDVWHDAEESGLALWIPALAMAFGFLVITYFTRGSCGHGHGDDPRDDHRPAAGRHRLIKASATPAAFGGVGAAAALTMHRVIEGTTLALTPSAAVIAALAVHSASEGLALAALLRESRERVAPWLVISVAGPVAGIIAATVSPLPETLVPVLLAMVGGVLLRTAIVGVKLAAAKRRAGELRDWHIVVAAVSATAFGALMLFAH